MITMNDVALATNPDKREDGILLAFAIDDLVVHVMGTFVWFYDLITAGYEVVEERTMDGSYVVSFKDGESIVETFQCSELLSALLRSEPRVLVIVREPRPSLEEIGIKRFVDVNWSVNSEGEFIPPKGWVNPSLNRPVLTEEQNRLIQLAKEQGKTIAEVVALNGK